jgi:hypothetical protein
LFLKLKSYFNIVKSNEQILTSLSFPVSIQEAYRFGEQGANLGMKNLRANARKKGALFKSAPVESLTVMYKIQ